MDFLFFFFGSVFGGYSTIEWVGVAGQYGFLASLALFCSFEGYGTIEMVGRGRCVSPFTFLSLLSVPLACGYAR
jgi:hypothetical protein